MSSGLVALSSAAVVAVYGAGYARTKTAAERLEEASTRRQLTPDPRLGLPVGTQPDPVADPAPVVPQPAAVTTPSVEEAAPPPPALPQTASAAVMAAAKVATAAVPSVAKVTATVPASSKPAESSTEVAAPSSTTPPADSDVVPSAPSADHKSAEPAASNPAPVASAAMTAAAAPVDPAPSVAAPPAPKPPAFKDGTYTGWGTCRHGDIQAEVVIASGRITSARISQCWTRYTCNWLDPVVPQVVQRQSPAIDYVSGATQSTDAFYYAVLDALLKAK